MKFLVEIPDSEIRDIFPENSAELTRLDILEAMDGDSCFFEVKATCMDRDAVATSSTELLECLEIALRSVLWRIDVHGPCGFIPDREARAALKGIAQKCQSAIAKAKTERAAI